MFIELETIFNNEGAFKEFSYEFSIDDCDVCDKVHASGVIKNNTGIVSMNAQAEFVLKTTCDRCAAPIERKTTIPVNHLLVAHLNDEDNDDFILVEDMHFNVDELIREDILLSLPTKILCRDDCKGICPYCGANLNEKQCNCKKPVDPRLEALKQFLD